jgi:ADP-ribose pyrophosphatase
MAADAGFEILNGKVVAETPFLRVEELNLQGPDGTVAPRSVVRIGGAVAVVAIDGDDVVLIKQYRTALDRAIVELPAGKLDIPDEDPQAAAARELGEEVGYTADRWEQIAYYNTSPGYSDEFVIIYLAQDLTPVGMNRIGPEEEAAEVIRIPIARIREVLPSIEDSKTVIGLQALLLSEEFS